MANEPLDIGEDKSLLLVDDDEPFLKRLAKAMEKRGFSVEQAGSVAAGRAIATARPPAFAVVDLRLEDGRYVGSGSRFNNDLNAPLISTSYFNPNFIRQKAFVSSQDGRLLPTGIKTVGVETLKINNAPVSATRFALSGKLEIDIWYADDGRWVKTQFERGRFKVVVQQTNPSRIPPRKQWERP